MDRRDKMVWKRGKVAFVLLTMQVIVILLFILKSHYGKDANAADPIHNLAPAISGQDPKSNSIFDYTQSFDDILKVTFLTSGMALSGIKDYTLSGIGLNLLFITVSLQFCLILAALSTPPLQPSFFLQIDIHRIMNSLQNCYTISITILASLSGKMSILQLLFTLVVYIISQCIYSGYASRVNVFEVTTGKFYHNLLYAAYFTVGSLLFVNCKSGNCENSNHVVSTSNVNSCSSSSSQQSSTTRRSHHSHAVDHFVILVSIVLLFISYPSVLSAGISGDKKHRIIVNTLLALTSSSVTAFSLASIIDPQNRFNVRLIQVGVHSGASAITAVAGLMIHPYGALLIGFAAPILSVVSFLHLTPFLSRIIHLEDRFCHLSSHCVPLLFGGLALALYSFIASPYEYGYTLYEVFPARSPLANSSDLEEILVDFPRIHPGLARTAQQQTAIQLMVLIVTIVAGLMFGAITALVAGKVKLFDPLPSSSHFTDSINWHISHNDTLHATNESNVNVSNCTDERVAYQRTGKDECSHQCV